MTTCLGEPVSWLALERANSGELSSAERQQLQAHASACGACCECIELIENDRRFLRPLPALEELDAKPLFLRFSFAMAACAAAAAIVLAASFVLMFRDHRGDAGGSQPIPVKGGDMALTLLRERDGVVVENPKVYLSGDRFSLLLTCPWPDPVEWDVVVFKEGEAFFPIQASGPASCGNRILLPGAFRLTGDGLATVCVMVGDDMPDREEISEFGREALPEDSICYEIESASCEDGDEEF